MGIAEGVVAAIFLVALLFGTSKPLDEGENVETTSEFCLICVETKTKHEELGSDNQGSTEPQSPAGFPSH
jgi:hypothetical protein